MLFRLNWVCSSFALCFGVSKSVCIVTRFQLISAVGSRSEKMYSFCILDSHSLGYTKNDLLLSSLDLL